jgi:hypothetical protein
MKRKMTRLAILLGVLVALAPVLVALGQTSEVEILFPVHGTLTMRKSEYTDGILEETLYLLDGFTGDGVLVDYDQLMDNLKRTDMM